MGEKFRLARAAELEALGAFRDLIERACAQADIDSATCYELKLAIDEAASNVITHGYAGMNPGSIILDVEVRREQVVMTLTDFGHCFEPAEPPTPNVRALMHDPSSGGFGLFLIHRTMDEVSYQTTEDGNRLTLVKLLGRPAGSGNNL